MVSRLLIISTFLLAAQPAAADMCRRVIKQEPSAYTIHKSYSVLRPLFTNWNMYDTLNGIPQYRRGSNDSPGSVRKIITDLLPQQVLGLYNASNSRFNDYGPNSDSSLNIVKQMADNKMVSKSFSEIDAETQLRLYDTANISILKGNSQLSLRELAMATNHFAEARSQFIADARVTEVNFANAPTETIGGVTDMVREYRPSFQAAVERNNNAISSAYSTMRTARKNLIEAMGKNENVRIAFGTNDQLLAIADGDTVYVWAVQDTFAITELPVFVMTKENWNQMVLDAGSNPLVSNYSAEEGISLSPLAPEVELNQEQILLFQENYAGLQF